MAIEVEKVAAAEGGAAAGAAGQAPPQVRVLTLEPGEHRDSTIYRFHKGYRLQFCPAPGLLGRRVTLYTNYGPGEEEAGAGGGEPPPFERARYYALAWRRLRPDETGAPEPEPGDEPPAPPPAPGDLLAELDLCCELTLRRAGVYHYYFVCDSAEAGAGAGPLGSGWFHVPPTLVCGPLDGVACQTVVAKCLGPLPRWEAVLRVSHEAGYNMVHLTPVQRLGASGSAYSISDQLRLDPRYGPGAPADVRALAARLRARWGLASICDVVLNHTADETPWLAAHPDSAYNCAASPHLRPAALLDAALSRLTAAAARGDLAARGVPPTVDSPAHIEAVERILTAEVVPELRLHEMFMCDVDDVVRQYCDLARNRVPGGGGGGAEEGALRLAPDPLRRRLRATVDLELALRLYHVHSAEGAEGGEVPVCGVGGEGAARLARRLRDLNADAERELRDHLRAAVANCVAGMRYFRLQADGPKIAEVSEKHPLVPRYFSWAECPATAAEAEALVYAESGRRVMAHNGWVMDADPLQDFAAAAQGARVYLRRELVAWGDSVKLRYGDKPEDNPFLWAHMREYVELTADMFDGLRLDNCHSTPLHVAEYMLDCARRVNPELYVVAELFTNSDHVDNIFVNRLGITSLIREAQSAWDAREQGRLVHRFGGRAAGSLLRPARRQAAPRVAHALLLDLTHDNPSPLERRCVFDALPCAALVAVACSAAGSTRGLDELVPHQVHVVDEPRLYPQWAESDTDTGADGGAGCVGPAVGMLAARRALNELHRDLAAGGYSEVYVDQMDDDVVAVTRHNPRTRQSVILVAYTAFRAPDPAFPSRAVQPLRFEGDVDEVLLEATVRHRDHQSTGRPFQPPTQFVKHPEYINGLTEYAVSVRRHLPLSEARSFAAPRREGTLTVLAWRAPAPGDVVALRVSPGALAAAALRRLDASLAPGGDPLALAAPLRRLSLAELGRALYSSEPEERDATGGGAYDVPGRGPLVYAGLQGVASMLDEVRDDLGHPLCANLRAGDWLPEHLWRRLEGRGGEALDEVAHVLRDALRPLGALPRFLVPAYFAGLARGAHAAAEREALRRLGHAGRGDGAARALALTAAQLLGEAPSAALPPPSPRAAPPPPHRATLSAGLPHFAVGYMRCWGRDTFISLRGLLLLTGRYQEARAHILGFAACLRHGLIPNLLAGGRDARYNCRDAVWWWLLSIKQYCTEVPEGWSLLQEPVSRLFPSDDAPPAPPGAADQPLHDVVQEALQVHFQGLVFRERNAGPQIDAHMRPEGFEVQIGIDPETGFPFGGNDWNCGTWMDKMGSSERAGTRGRPATPRDGSAVELVALAHCAAAWLRDAHAARRYPHAGLRRAAPAAAWTWAQWAARIRDHFERCFWVPPAPSAADARPDLVHRRAIYKDTHGATRPWADYQLRCNYVLAMAVAPDLFEPRRAWLALDSVERLLLGPLGVKTLDPADWAYRGAYRNADDSTDPSVAHGFNYHQGPEWVWPLGYYLRARLAFARANGRHASTVAAALAALGPLLAELRASAWRGLPELTDAGGAYCRDSCRTQAWSSASALEALHDIELARRARPLAAD